MTEKTYATRAAAKKAIENRGFHKIPHQIDPVGGIRNGKACREYKPTFFAALPEDVTYIRSKGFAAVLDPSKHEENQ